MGTRMKGTALHCSCLSVALTIRVDLEAITKIVYKRCTVASARLSSHTARTPQILCKILMVCSVGSVSALRWCFTICQVALPLRTALTKIATRSNTRLQILERATAISEINHTFFSIHQPCMQRKFSSLFLFFQLDVLLL